MDSERMFMEKTGQTEQHIIESDAGIGVVFQNGSKRNHGDANRRTVDDPAAKRPSDRDEAAFGTWEAPVIPNERCLGAPGWGL
jgi:hypothetical protein